MPFYFFFSSEIFGKVVVSDPNHLLSSIAEVLNALILPSESMDYCPQDNGTLDKNAIQSPPWVQV